jgi:hypothetical protein
MGMLNNLIEPEKKGLSTSKLTRKKESPVAHGNNNSKDKERTLILDSQSKQEPDSIEEDNQIENPKASSIPQTLPTIETCDNLSPRYTLVDTLNKYHRALENVSKIISALGLEDTTQGLESNLPPEEDENPEITQNYYPPEYQTNKEN